MYHVLSRIQYIKANITENCIQNGTTFLLNNNTLHQSQKQSHLSKVI